MEWPRAYTPSPVEAKWTRFWREMGLSKLNLRRKRPAYTLMMPPPNVTGSLTLGHVLNNTIQDILARWKRMQGFLILWQPGLDHAGIATQNVLERQLAKEQKTRFDLGRQVFLERLRTFTDSSRRMIFEQFERLGISPDWSRTKFTLEEEYSEAVLEAFVKLYEAGLIYKGQRIVHWCPRCTTALSDDEVEWRETKGELFYLRYPIVGEESELVVATTRPETYLGDTAVAFHPEDARYLKMVGKRVRLPLIAWKRKPVSTQGGEETIGPEIPVLTHPQVDRDFGTGVVKITPAHDAYDFEMGEEKRLPKVLVFLENGRMNENAGPYQGLDRYEARAKIVEDLKRENALLKVEPHTHLKGHCYRCDTEIEPYLSEQWFVRMKPLAAPALKAVEEGRVRIIPDSYKKVYDHWLQNVRDWCISRQIWWGHRIPVYYCDACGETVVSKKNLSTCPHCASKVRQDEDVLDTWFSSWLWPFATLGWPRETEELRRFYPNDVLVTGWDILFFWVARMIMAGLFFMKEIPFRVVYIHGLLRDERRRKLSKSLGNSPDPIELFDRYGVDAVRMGMMYMTPEGQDVLFSEKRVEVGRNFANKLWNATRLLLGEGDRFERAATLPKALELEDRWILTEFNDLIEEITNRLENFDFNEVSHLLYDFFWHRYCDWYLEALKVRLASHDRKKALRVALYVLDRFLRLLHPVMPFISEELWHRLQDRGERSIANAPWPEPDRHRYPDAQREFGFLMALVPEVREIRTLFQITPNIRLPLLLKMPEGEEKKALLLQKRDLLQHMVGLSEVFEEEIFPPGTASGVLEGIPFGLPLGDLLDLDTERIRLEREKEILEEQLEATRRRLEEKDFVQKAPSLVVDREREKEHAFTDKLEKLRSILAELETPS